MRHRSMFLASILFSRVHGCICMLLLLSWMSFPVSETKGKATWVLRLSLFLSIEAVRFSSAIATMLDLHTQYSFYSPRWMEKLFCSFIFCNSKSAVICWLTWICEESYNIVLFWLWVKLALKVPITQCWWKGVCLAVLCKVAWWPFCQVHWI